MKAYTTNSHFNCIMCALCCMSEASLFNLNFVILAQMRAGEIKEFLEFLNMLVFLHLFAVRFHISQFAVLRLKVGSQDHTTKKKSEHKISISRKSVHAFADETAL